MAPNKCLCCKRQPVVLPSGAAMCTVCGISANTLEQWDKFNKPQVPKKIDALIEELETPVAMLGGIAALTDDEGIRRLAGGVLLKLNKLNMEPYFVSKEEAKAYEQQLKTLLERTGASGVLRERVVRD